METGSPGRASVWRRRSAAEPRTVRTNPIPPHDRERLSAPHPSPQPSAGEHWSSTIRRRVAEGRTTPEAGTPDAEDEGAPSPAAEAPGVRERVERRLQEAEGPSESEFRPVRGFAEAGSGRSAARCRGRFRAGEFCPSGLKTRPGGTSPGPRMKRRRGPAGETRPADAPSRLAAFVATCAFIGRIPVAPGTAGAGRRPGCLSADAEPAGQPSRGPVRRGRGGRPLGRGRATRRTFGSRTRGRWWWTSSAGCGWRSSAPTRRSS